MSDEKLGRIEDKIDILGDRLASIDKTLAAQQVSIDYHIKRTDLLEDSIKPIEKHVMLVSAVMKIFGALAVLGATAEGLISILEYVRK